MNKKVAGLENEERFDQMVGRLEHIVATLEKGELPLEEALKAFEEGVGLVRRGQAKLDVMERRVEVLMTDGSTQPLQPGPGEAGSPAAPATGPTPRSDDELPF